MIAIASTQGSGPPADAALADLLSRAGAYVVEYAKAFSDLVAEETLTQWAGLPADTARGAGQRVRHLRADLVFVTLPGGVPWSCFRDVYEVDGQKVRDREERLLRLFRDGRGTALERAQAIVAESSRYNLGNAVRTVNIPTIPLAFLHPDNQGRFHFERKGSRRFHGREGIEVQFTEIARPTIVTGWESGDLAAKGRFWIHAETGTVLRSATTFRFEPGLALANLATAYAPEPGLAIWVPVEMTERYEDLPNASRAVFRELVTSTARYAKYRRFTVTTEEAVNPGP